MGKRFFVLCRENAAESAIQELTSRGCVMVSEPRKLSRRRGTLSFVVRSPFERSDWIKTVDGVEVVREDYQFSPF